jgi:hypothetical protein
MRIRHNQGGIAEKRVTIPRGFAMWRIRVGLGALFVLG